MGKKYEYGINPISDIFVSVILDGFDFTAKDSQKKIHDTMVYVIQGSLSKPEFIQYMDFEIQTWKDVYVKIIPKNILTALWFCAIIPKDSSTTLLNNYFEYKDDEYVFDKRKKKLIITKKRKNG